MLESSWVADWRLVKKGSAPRASDLSQLCNITWDSKVTQAEHIYKLYKFAFKFLFENFSSFPIGDSDLNVYDVQ
jgi:hypothetical protein